MYCPRCSQQQMPNEVRFCSRCGFQLMGVSQLLRTDGTAFIQTKERLPLIKRQELRKGAKLIFLSFFSVIPSFILTAILHSPLPLMIPVLTFLVGLAQMIYYFLFGESILPVNGKPSVFNEYQNQLIYPPVQSLPFERNSFNTAEFIQPPSITEPTANLFKNK